MPNLVRKLVIVAAVDGLVLQPAATQQQAIKVDSRGNVGPLLHDRHAADTASARLEAHGIVGLLRVASACFLIAITGHDHVAQVRGKPVYKLTDVRLLPLSSPAAASHALASARADAQPAGPDDDDDHDADSDDGTTASSEVVAAADSTVAADVIQRKGVYGRFADSWFSRKGWSADRRRTHGLSAHDTLPPHAPAGHGLEHEHAATIALLPKILHTTRLYLSTGNFFFSYDYDLSHAIGPARPDSSLPLFKQFDPLFFWNQHVAEPFIDAGQHAFVLPLIQGFVGQRPFTIKREHPHSNSVVIDPAATPDDIQLQSWHEKQTTDADSGSDTTTDTRLPDESNGKDFLLTLISRRSTHRAGLRYLRRGTDDEGFTANSVETEQILSSPTWNTAHDKIFSYTQFRGSIPLFFSQSPYSLKPQVNTWGTFETNARAFKRHFEHLMSRYGTIYCASLIDKHGTEAKIGELYEQHANALNENGGIDGQGKKLGFEWFDFHNVCRGMHFENVSRLMTTLDPFTSSTGWTVISDDQIEHKQSGVLRTNCMDCLDRTNVVQSACARTALEAQLSAGSYKIDLQNDSSTSWFNTLWADNGDNISRQYAGTAALKGDFTRTRKRQITGALTDFGLTLSRYYNNIVNDYFTQALIDYLLGRATDTIFAEFEADMKSSDYFIDMRKVRQQAIDRSAGIVIEDGDEDLVHGWTLNVPTAANQVKTATFEEAVLLLTDKALYFCRLDWGTEKVREFERIPLENLQGLMRGVYITSTLAQRHMDADKNVGFVIQYKSQSGGGSLVRRNTRALDSSAAATTTDEPRKENAKQEEEAGRFLAFKALPPRSNISSWSDSPETPDNEVEVVKSVCDEIARIANKKSVSQPKAPDDTTQEEGLTWKEKHGQVKVEEKDIISLADAKKTTGYLEQLEYSLKKWVWG
ncbi:hypothetical protein ACEQ8H_006635 [Pleosporales sp. CAS-2024a]